MDIKVRNSQAITTYGTGAIADFPELSLMMLSPDLDNAWGSLIGQRKLKDERLAEFFDVEYFVTPPESGHPSKALQGVRFPSVLNCPNCKTLHYVRELELTQQQIKGQTPDEAGVGYLCPTCQSQHKKNYRLVPSRFVIATEDGHIDDFPYDWFVHRKPVNRGNRYRFDSIVRQNSCYETYRLKGQHLKLESQGNGANLSDIIVRCKNCQASENLGGIFNQKSTFLAPGDVYLSFTGYHMPAPWRGRVPDRDRRYWNFVQQRVNTDVSSVKVESLQNDPKHPRTLQRGAGNTWFPVTIRAISLPPEADIKETNSEQEFLHLEHNITQKSVELRALDSYDEKIKTMCNWDDAVMKQWVISSKIIEFRNYLQRKQAPIVFKPENRKENLRREEYRCFSEFMEETSKWYKSIPYSSQDYDDVGFQRLIEKVVILDKLLIYQILKGFTRVRPLSFDELAFVLDPNVLSGAYMAEYNRICDVRHYDGMHPLVKDKKRTAWLPAAEVRGEGIFIQFNNSSLEQWSEIPEVKHRESIMNNNFRNGLAKFSQSLEPEEYIGKSARYVFLHTLSHVLLQEIAIECGYNLASLAEVIYCNEQNSSFAMNGILIYTKSSDSEGTLGGLSDLGRPGRLDRILRKAVQNAFWCSSDPLCMSAETGQGFMGVNMAACHSCCMVPETSCENMNKFLDRAFLVGSLNNGNLGYLQKIGYFD